MKGNGQHEWEKIKNVNDYVNMLVENPEIAREIASDEEEKDIVDVWCNEKAYKNCESKP